MTLDEIRNYCLSLNGVTESIKWEDHLCFCVGEKMFVITSPDHFPVTASFKTTDELFEELVLKEGVIPAPYLARNKWVHVDDIERLTHEEWINLIDIAYNLIFAKLPLKTKKLILGTI